MIKANTNPRYLGRKIAYMDEDAATNEYERWLVDYIHSGDIDEDDIGSVAILGNTEVACQEWEVRRIFKDEGTNMSHAVLVSRFSLTDHIRFSEFMHNSYDKSLVRSFLNRIVCNGFSYHIQSNLQYVEEDDFDFITIPGVYDKHDNHMCTTALSGIRCNKSGDNIIYWTKTACDNDGWVKVVSGTGEIKSFNCYADSASVIGLIVI